MTRTLEIVHVELSEANEFVARLHRHHKPVRGHRFSIGAHRDGALVGVAITGRPVARVTNQRETLEVTRLCTDGSPHVCSALYSACARAGRELGYHRIQTYILEAEPGTSLNAAGWILIGTTTGRDWNCPSRGGRRTDQPMCNKTKWGKTLR